jgi:protein CrcB
LKAHGKHLSAVAAGSALGGVVRFAAVNLSVYSIPPPFPWGTLAVNVIGSLIIGWLAGWSRAEGRHYLSPEARLFLMVGFCGGLTTFSFFAGRLLLSASPAAQVFRPFTSCRASASAFWQYGEDTWAL